MRKSLILPLIAGLGLIFSACAPADDKESSSDNLRALTLTEKISALKLQLPILSVQEALFLVADPTFELGSTAAEVTDLATQLSENCDVRTLEDDSYTEANSNQKRKKVVVEIKASATKANCPITATLTRDLAKRINGKVAQPQERGQVDLLIRGVATHPLLLKFGGAKYEYSLQKRETNSGSAVRTELSRTSSGNLVQLDGKKVAFGASDLVDTTAASAGITEKQVTKVTLKPEELVSVWEQERNFENGEQKSESNKFNGETVSPDDFEKIRLEASK